jgi:putative addiction module component (TIGR02574 family)
MLYIEKNIEKILLVEDLWEDIATDDSDIFVHQSHKNQLNKRLARFLNDKSKLVAL